MKIEEPLWLASRSPRRRQMLEDAGFDIAVMPPDFDDGNLVRGQASPAEWVAALACLKARRVAELLRTRGESHGTVIGADTMCVQGEAALGQPRDAEDARRMLLSLRSATHETMTGVCLVSLKSDSEFTFCDSAVVRIGEVTDRQIDEYIASGEWRGKAGAYNLSERIADGWPIECFGDPATVMGLPMQRLREMLLPD